MFIDIPNLECKGDVLHTVRVEYKLEPPRCGMCMVFGHDDEICPKRVVDKPKKQNSNCNEGFQHNSKREVSDINMGPKV